MMSEFADIFQQLTISECIGLFCSLQHCNLFINEHKKSDFDKTIWIEQYIGVLFVMDWLDPLICQLVFICLFTNMSYAALYHVSLCTTVADKGCDILGIKLI